MSENHQDSPRREHGQLVAAVDTRLAERAYGQLGPATNILDLTASENLSRNFREYLGILLNRKGLILSIMAACLAIGAFRALTTTPEFTSTLRLQIDRNVAKVIDNGATNVSGKRRPANSCERSTNS